VKKNDNWFRIDKNLERIDHLTFSSIQRNKYWGYSEKAGKFTILNTSAKSISEGVYEGKWTNYVSSSKYIFARKGEYYLLLDNNGYLIKTVVLKE
jgi:hypothetical protein